MPSPWTTEALKEHVDARFGDLKGFIADAKVTMDQRLEGMNEFRDSLRDQSDKFASKEALNLLVTQVQELRISGGGAVGRAEGRTPFIEGIVKVVLGVLVGYVIFAISR